MSSLTKSLPLPVRQFLTPALIFMVSTMIVNAGNYGYNLVLGRMLSPAQFSEAGLMVTLFLATSFLAMTFQIVSTKFTVDLESEHQQNFKSWFGSLSVKIGLVLGLVIALFSSQISSFFHLSSPFSIAALGIALPAFFLMSVKRGVLQGKERFIPLSSSYQLEMWGRCILTVVLVLVLSQSVDLLVGLAILGSVVLGYAIIREPLRIQWKTNFLKKSHIIQFLLLTALYEGAQILINYADILMVKHYFDATSAGLYTSMALIGRMIYFMTWMVVMILIPKVLRLRKEGGNYRGAMLKYFAGIAGFSGALILGSFLFSEQIVLVLFGSSYLPVAPLLWQYGLATMFFALANLLCYYFLSLDHKLPVFVALFFGVLQVVLFTVFHESLAQMILVQIVNMGVFLIFSLVYFFVNRL